MYSIGSVLSILCILQQSYGNIQWEIVSHGSRLDLHLILIKILNLNLNKTSFDAIVDVKFSILSEQNHVSNRQYVSSISRVKYKHLARQIHTCIENGHYWPEQPIDTFIISIFFAAISNFANIFRFAWIQSFFLRSIT